MHMLNEYIFTEKQLTCAYQWLCIQRKHFPPNSDIWHLRFHWLQQKRMLLTQLNNHTFYFQPLQRITKANGEVIHLWSFIDSLVLKMLAQTLSELLPSSLYCTHIKGHGGEKQTVRDIHQQIPHHSFVFRTDVKSYYASIDHTILLAQLDKYVEDPLLRNLLSQYVKRTLEVGGTFKSITKGISAGCPLSPLIASFYLFELDKAMENKQVFYRRYMDDIIILAVSKWQLRRAIKTVNTFFEYLRLKQHPDKTYIGRISKEFDFLGYQFGKATLGVSVRTMQNHVCRLLRLYEQKQSCQNKATLLFE